MVAIAAGQLAGLIVRLDADISPFERKLKQALRVTDGLSRRFNAVVLSAPASKERLLDGANRTGQDAARFRKAGAPAGIALEKSVEILVDTLIERALDPNISIREQLFEQPIDVDRLGQAHEAIGERAAELEKEVAEFKKSTTILDIPHQQKGRNAAALRIAQDEIVGVLAAQRDALRRELEALPDGLPNLSPIFQSIIDDLTKLEDVLLGIGDRSPGLVDALSLGFPPPPQRKPSPPDAPPLPQRKPTTPEEMQELLDFVPFAQNGASGDDGSSGRLTALEQEAQLLGEVNGLRAEAAALLDDEAAAGSFAADAQAALVDGTLAGSDALRVFVDASDAATEAQVELGGIVPQTTEGIEAQAEAFDELAQSVGAAEPEIEETEERMAEIEAAGERAGDALGRAFDDLIVGGKSLDEVLKQLERDLLSILETSLFGAGGVGGFLSGALGGLLGGSSLAAAGGGLVRGPGSSSSDSIPARLSDGEFVVNAAATRANRALLEAINAGHPLRALATGGIASCRISEVVAASSRGRWAGLGEFEVAPKLEKDLPLPRDFNILP